MQQAEERIKAAGARRARGGGSSRFSSWLPRGLATLMAPNWKAEAKRLGEAEAKAAKGALAKIKASSAVLGSGGGDVDALGCAHDFRVPFDRVAARSSGAAIGLVTLDDDAIARSTLDEAAWAACARAASEPRL